MRYTYFCLSIFLVAVLCQVRKTNRTECSNFKCEGDNFCFQGYCNSCDGPRTIWERRKPQWGFQVGEASTIPAFSNFGDPNILDNSKDDYLFKNQTGLDQNIYVGQKYQCVHYARKFWILKFQVTFGSVNTANEIFELETGYNLATQATIPLLTFSNGNIDRPQSGDLLIWKKDDDQFPNGHVAVILDIETNSQNPHVVIAEQNYDQTWDTRNFSRALKIIIDENGAITITNQRQSFPTKDDLKCRDSVTDSNLILGWKRLKQN